jgi:hypothetical protein
MRPEDLSWIKVLCIAASILVLFGLSAIAFQALPRSMGLFSYLSQLHRHAMPFQLNPNFAYA